MSDNVYPMTFGGNGGISEAEADRLNDRTEAMRYPCTYSVPESMRSRHAVTTSDEGEDRYRCNAAVGQQCRVPGTEQLLTRQAAHLPRLRAAGRA